LTQLTQTLVVNIDNANRRRFVWARVPALILIENRMPQYLKRWWVRQIHRNTGNQNRQYGQRTDPWSGNFFHTLSA
jgi:hypothetical protein